MLMFSLRFQGGLQTIDLCMKPISPFPPRPVRRLAGVYQLDYRLLALPPVCCSIAPSLRHGPDRPTDPPRMPHERKLPQGGRTATISAQSLHGIPTGKAPVLQPFEPFSAPPLPRPAPDRVSPAPHRPVRIADLSQPPSAALPGTTSGPLERSIARSATSWSLQKTKYRISDPDQPPEKTRAAH